MSYSFLISKEKGLFDKIIKKSVYEKSRLNHSDGIFIERLFCNRFTRRRFFCCRPLTGSFGKKHAHILHDILCEKNSKNGLTKF